MDNGKRGKRVRRRAGGLRKHQDIENVKVEESFQLHSAGAEAAGDGVYVSVVNNGKRLYGVLVDQTALKEASQLFFQDQAESLELNRRMKVLHEQKENGNDDSQSLTVDDNQCKRPKTECDNDQAALSISGSARMREQPVQKFKYVEGTETKSTVKPSERTSDYRILMATFCDVMEASDGDPIKAEKILRACEEGGSFVGPFYYQFEVMPATLTSQQSQSSEFEMRTSMGFHSFLQNTALPSWFPLSNLQSGSHKLLSMLNMKRDNNGNVVYDIQNRIQNEVEAALAGGTRMPMQPRINRYEIGVLGGGIAFNDSPPEFLTLPPCLMMHVAGLAASHELLVLLRAEGIDARVTLLEGRDRLGGRLWTDNSMSEKVPIELGAQWIHGIDDNPLAALCKQANIDFVTASEDVTMLGPHCERIDSTMDDNMGKLFDDLLDHAADDCWSPQAEENQSNVHDAQAAVKWYSSVFLPGKQSKTVIDGSLEGQLPNPTGVPGHRSSSDRSVDFEIAKAVSKHKLREFSKLGEDEHRMLLWNTKNIEYALGANVSDLSMKFWDSDERHAFEGDHVLLKQGYSAVVDHVFQSLEKEGKDRFNCILNYPVGKIEYARKSDTKQYGRDSLGRNRKVVELSDTCSVTRQGGEDTKYFDFLVCAVPLGVLKEAVVRAEEVDTNKVSFQPSLPFSKVDSITNVGFGLLDKVFLHFENPFWRQKGDIFTEAKQSLFGNVTGKNPHHYMFFDVGKCLGTSEEKEPPAILMSLISGKEAVLCEQLSDEELVAEMMETLGSIFSDEALPKPIAHRITRWGQDRFSRGSYTFLPPGATDQDFQLLQSPINGNGDSIWIEGSETMRLFFAGEHTTALHPSMAHGAMLSGIRAAKEIVSTLQFKNSVEKDVDRIIPEPLFRHKNPTTTLQCILCHKKGGQLREGRLVSFKRGARQVLVHNNCAEFSPEVEVLDSKFKHVIKATNRAKSLNCSLCTKSGATIGCTSENCFRVFHFSCAEDTGWRFDRDSKVFYCDLHRPITHRPKDHSDRISLKFLATKQPMSSMVCSFCHSGGEAGELLAYQASNKQVCVHSRCLKFSNNVDVPEIENSRVGHEYRNVFTSIERSALKVCLLCNRHGASVVCTAPFCDESLHVACAERSGWNFKKKGKIFLCKKHRSLESRKQKEKIAEPVEALSTATTSLVTHNLLSQFGAVSRENRVSIPSNEAIEKNVAPAPMNLEERGRRHDDFSESSTSTEEYLEEESRLVMDVKLSSRITESENARRFVRVDRLSLSDVWNISLGVETKNQLNYLVVMESTRKDKCVGLLAGDVILSMNGTLMGSEGLKTLHDAMQLLKIEVVLMMEVVQE